MSASETWQEVLVDDGFESMEVPVGDLSDIADLEFSDDEDEPADWQDEIDGPDNDSLVDIEEDEEHPAPSTRAARLAGLAVAVVVTQTPTPAAIARRGFSNRPKPAPSGIPFTRTPLPKEFLEAYNSKKADEKQSEYDLALERYKVMIKTPLSEISDPTDDELEEIEERWQERSNCLGVSPELFFPERGASTREAKEVCKGCVVREECLEFALATGEKHGIWGGMSERERRRVRRKRAQERQTAAKQAVKPMTLGTEPQEAVAELTEVAV